MRVSCLMVTLPERHGRMVRALKAWDEQTHADRELIVVVDPGPPEAHAAAVAAISRFDDSRIRLVIPDTALTLGALRNLAVDHAAGDVFCVWDDDDLHHPQRLARQLAALTEADCEAAVLQDVMLYGEGPRILHWMNWAATPAGGHPGTLLCRRAAMPRYTESGPTARLGEDLDLLLRIKARHPVCQQAMAPHLCVYVTHGANSWPSDHHARLASSLAISKGLLQRREPALREGLEPFGLKGVSVHGSNGYAFTI